MNVLCAECGSLMTLRKSKYGQFYGCTRYPQCKGAHGAHPNGDPLGLPATKETKVARIAAHDAFDSIWSRETGWMSRAEAYRWLKRTTGLEHIGSCSLEECERIIHAVKLEMTNRKE
jgi:ssDNA-binding Zn-finger/Zn-ribbon topoisomerase 1